MHKHYLELKMLIFPSTTNKTGKQLRFTLKKILHQDFLDLYRLLAFRGKVSPVLMPLFFPCFYFSS